MRFTYPFSSIHYGAAWYLARRHLTPQLVYRPLPFTSPSGQEHVLDPTFRERHN